MISVIIPVYNVAPYLDQCLESVINQTYNDWECILIDDGSKDNSGEICDKWGKIDSRFRIIHQINQGVSAARNSGIEESKGKFIVFIDSDDWVNPNYLSDMRNAILKHNSDLVITGNNHHEPEGQITTFKPKKELYFKLNDNSTSEFINNIGLFYGPYSKIFKADIIKKNNIKFPIDFSLGEDLLFNFQYLENIKYILCLPVANYNYRILNSGSLTSIYRDNTFDIQYYQWKVQQEFLISRDMWNEISQKHFYKKLWGIVYNGLFNKINPSYTYINKIVNIKETTELRKWNEEFSCPLWIKKLILNKHRILLFSILNYIK